MVFLSVEKYVIISVTVVAAVVVLALVALAAAKKKTPKNKAGSEGDRQLVEQNAKLVDILIAMETNADGKAGLAALKEKLKYLMPTDKDEVYAKDIEIKKALDDFKIAVTKHPDRADVVEDNVKEIEVLVAEPNSYL